MVAAIALLDIAATAGISRTIGALPAGIGGLTGLLGAAVLHWCAHFAGAAQGWVAFGLALVIGGAGVFLACTVFALEGWRFNPLSFLPRRTALAEDADDDAAAPAPRARVRETASALAVAEPVPAESTAPRRTTEITDPTRAPAPYWTVPKRCPTRNSPSSTARCATFGRRTPKGWNRDERSGGLGLS